VVAAQVWKISTSPPHESTTRQQNQKPTATFTTELSKKILPQNPKRYGKLLTAIRPDWPQYFCRRNQKEKTGPSGDLRTGEHTR